MKTKPKTKMEEDEDEEEVEKRVRRGKRRMQTYFLTKYNFPSLFPMQELRSREVVTYFPARFLQLEVKTEPEILVRKV